MSRRSHGLARRAALIEPCSRPHVERRSGAVYDSLGGGRAASRLPTLPAAGVERLAGEGGLRRSRRARTRIEGRRGGGKAARYASTAAREALEAVLPGLIAAFARGAGPAGQALHRFDAMLCRLPSAINLFRLLEAQPARSPACWATC